MTIDPLRVNCPFCGAAVGNPCVNRPARQVEPHLPRVKAAAERARAWGTATTTTDNRQGLVRVLVANDNGRK